MIALSVYDFTSENSNPLNPTDVAKIRIGRLDELLNLSTNQQSTHEPLGVPSSTAEATFLSIEMKKGLSNEPVRASRKSARDAYRSAMVRAFLDLKFSGLLKATDAPITANMLAIQQEAGRRLAEASCHSGASAPDQEMPRAVSSRALRRWVYAYQRGGDRALASPWFELARYDFHQALLMATVIEGGYLSHRKKSAAAVLEDVRSAFIRENKRRRTQGLPRLEVPDKGAARRFFQAYVRALALPAFPHPARWATSPSQRQPRSTVQLPATSVTGLPIRSIVMAPEGAGS